MNRFYCLRGVLDRFVHAEQCVGNNATHSVCPASVEMQLQKKRQEQGKEILKRKEKEKKKGLASGKTM